jgi:hypothetical protein
MGRNKTEKNYYFPFFHFPFFPSLTPTLFREEIRVLELRPEGIELDGDNK